jgi:hypothetical protein
MTRWRHERLHKGDGGRIGCVDVEKADDSDRIRCVYISNYPFPFGCADCIGMNRPDGRILSSDSKAQITLLRYSMTRILVIFDSYIHRWFLPPSPRSFRRASHDRLVSLMFVHCITPVYLLQFSIRSETLSILRSLRIAICSWPSRQS